MSLTSAQARAVACLTNVVASDLAEPLRAAAATMLALQRRGAQAGEPEYEAALDGLADAVAALPGTLATHIDAMRVLHGKAVYASSLRRRNLGAVLRNACRRLGRLPCEADFAPAHPVHLFGVFYWGGVGAWAAMSTHRTQRPKGFWQERANQVAALRAVAAAHPDQPVTHAVLARHGLHRLGQTLDAVQLAALAAEAGVDRKLLHLPDGHWTADRVIDRYAELCRNTGMTLSTAALKQLGGEASSLRIYARRHFGRFAAFQAAVIARCPEIQPPDRPTAADGTRLDSWSEVPVYEALRAAFPAVRVEVHVVLPGQASRSTDFLLDRRVYVEVLSIALADMPAANSRRQRKYVAQWTAKQACYDALGVTPVVVEPVDVHDKRRLAERLGEVARLLGCASPPIPPGSTRCTRAKGSWTFDALCQAVEEVAGASGMLPTYAALGAAGYGHAAVMLRQHGMRARVAEALKL